MAPGSTGRSAELRTIRRPSTTCWNSIQPASHVSDPRRSARSVACRGAAASGGLGGMTFEEMWADLAPVGRSVSSGGYFRQPWTSAETELREWFRAAATGRGLDVEQDGLGNLLAWWRPDGADGPAVV